MTEGSGAFCFQVFCKIEAKEFRTLKGIWDPDSQGKCSNLQGLPKQQSNF